MPSLQEIADGMREQHPYHPQGRKCSRCCDCEDCKQIRLDDALDIMEQEQLTDEQVDGFLAEFENPLRQSIAPTYDSRETGPRFTVETRVNNRSIKEESIGDPFINTTVVVGWKDVLRAALSLKRLRISVHVRGDNNIIEDVMELDANHIGYHSTRREEFQGSIEKALERIAMTPNEEELN